MWFIFGNYLFSKISFPLVMFLNHVYDIFTDCLTFFSLFY